MKILTAIARTAARLCEAHDAQIYLVEGVTMRLVAQHGSVRTTRRLGEPFPVSGEAVHGRAVLARRAIHVHDLKAAVRTQYSELASRQRATGTRTILATPLLSGGAVVGVIMIRRVRVHPFTARQIALLKTFADQAVIAIENEGLVDELGRKNDTLAEALAQQTATGEILQILARAATEVSPVFDAVVARTAHLCEAADVAMLLVDGSNLRIASGVGPLYRSIPSDFTSPLTRGAVAARSVLDRTTIHVDDLLAESDEEYPVGRALAARFGHRTMLAVPLLREGVPIGVICAFRLEVRPFSDRQLALLRTFADQAVIAIENVRLFKELETRNADLTEALEQQTATGEVLRALSSSPTDLQPVLDTVVKSAARFCGAYDVCIFRLDGGQLRLDAHHGPVAQPDGFLLPVVEGTVGGRTVLERRVIHVADLPAETAEFPEAAANARRLGFRTILSAPLVREGVAIGAIQLRRAEANPFTDKQITLLETFADQAVIAIENVRLFTELEARNRDLTDALEQQTATSEILRVISASPTDLRPVLDEVVKSAARFCGADDASIFRVVGGDLRADAHHGPIPGPIGTLVPIVRGTVGGRSVLERRPIHVADAQAETEDFPEGSATARRIGHRTIVSAPLLREETAIGAIMLRRAEASAFTDKQISLLQTFADQAVIAIENVRLFTELQEKNRALTEAHEQVTEALEQQTATGDVLRAIAHTQTDTQPVFETIVESAARLCRATVAAVFRTDGRTVYMPANYGSSPEARAVNLSRFPRPLDRNTTAGVAILTRAIVHVPDTEGPEAVEFLRESGRLLGFRSAVTVPMLRESEAIGAITLTRPEPGRFSDAEVALLSTFADQAVIAIENVRLFNELAARTAALTRSVDQLTALGEVGRAVGSTLDLATVLTTIVARAVDLSRLDGGVVFEYEEDAQEFVQRAQADTGGALAAARRATRVRKGEGVVGRTAITLEPVQVPDISTPGAYVGPNRENLIESGIRAILAVPMVHQSRLMGCLGVTRNRPGDFPAETVELLRTFATQSALAIQNARLFHEIADKSRQLEAASRHKSEFLANMSHELRTPLNAVIGFSEVLLQRMFGELNDKQDEYLKDIYASGQHLLSLINDILDLSKIEAGRMELAPVPFHLPGALENAVILVRERAGRHGIALELDVDSALGEVVGDERKVKQVVLNLLSNAVKFTPEGGRIGLKAARRDTAVEISVTDTGIGIALEDQAAVFEEFRQVGSDERKREGTGLGLALARKFVELHGGRIWVESEPGRGSTFTFTLPVT